MVSVLSTGKNLRSFLILVVHGANGCVDTYLSLLNDEGLFPVRYWYRRQTRRTEHHGDKFHYPRSAWRSSSSRINHILSVHLILHVNQPSRQREFLSQQGAFDQGCADLQDAGDRVPESYHNDATIPGELHVYTLFCPQCHHHWFEQALLASRSMVRDRTRKALNQKGQD